MIYPGDHIEAEVRMDDFPRVQEQEPWELGQPVSTDVKTAQFVEARHGSDVVDHVPG